jgi:diketogulonate reductase-like aldo/keto reductase
VAAAQEPDELRASLEENLRTLDTDKLAAVNLRVHDEGSDPNAPADVNRDLFDRQLEAMIKARDEGLIGGIGLSNIVIEHLQIALDRTEIACVQNAYNLVDRTSQPVLDACIEHEHRVRSVLPARVRVHADNPSSVTAVMRRGGRTRSHPSPDRARMDARRSRRTCC